MSVIVTVNAGPLLDRLSGFPARLQKRMLQVVTRFSVELQAYVKASKLSGQVLHVRTGTLRRSINRRVVSTPSSVIGYVGTNVKYAAVHEYGFHGIVSVKTHVRKLKAGSKFSKKGAAINQTTVRAHVREVNLPERSFLRSALADKRTSFIKSMSSAVKEEATRK